jgi:hypothetical protein
MEIQPTVNEIFNVIDMLHGSEEDFTLAIEIISSFNSYINLCIASFFTGKKKDTILEKCNNFEKSDTTLKLLFKYIETEEDKEIFKYILTKRIELAARDSNIKENMKNIIKILEIDA